MLKCQMWHTVFRTLRVRTLQDVGFPVNSHPLLQVMSTPSVWELSPTTTLTELVGSQGSKESLCPHTREWDMEKNTAHWVWHWDWYCLLVFTPYCWFPPLQTGLGFTTQGGFGNRQQKLIMKREAVQMEQKISSGSGKSSFSSQFSYNCCIVLYGEELC